ncbi:hypothetical protein TRV_02458 [Trichophyton verrucosum HKI 0517]|uniref:Uncharacterized protein n=1 Tax=Trichophyton verrucosum (strain HKI 0517) TaxID=663202 RepID=D4D5T5_TRIVH|nr:uncharacterized protein TRV_02458 [Trichophyton verrucosum HKI 0517]EFE42738.1 hypothetical protein TRV_02458 [Trichophyton verrucosum HKI 0517]
MLAKKRSICFLDSSSIRGLESQGAKEKKQGRRERKRDLKHALIYFIMLELLPAGPLAAAAANNNNKLACRFCCLADSCFVRPREVRQDKPLRNEAEERSFDLCKFLKLLLLRRPNAERSGRRMKQSLL